MSRVTASKLPRLYMGSMVFGWEKSSVAVTETIATEMIKRAAAAGIYMIDSARIYANGETETIVGACFRSITASHPEIRCKLHVTTKAHPSQPLGLSAKGLEQQLQTSLNAMGVDYVDELYLHQPDIENDLVASLASAHGLVSRGLVKRIGMSNYHEVEVERSLKICSENKWTAPSLYQGLYNPLNRRVEASLLPLLKRNNIDFIAFNSLAGGMLTGKHTSVESVQDGRFKDNPNYLPRFYNDANFAAMRIIKESLPSDLDIITATYQWLLRHSMLSENDGILIGASSLDQLDTNIAALHKASVAPSLTKKTLEAFDSAWEVCRGVAFPYWRGYSRDQIGRETMDPGASYSVAAGKK